jgi:hypothetical protein
MKLYKTGLRTSQHGRAIWKDVKSQYYLVVFGIRSDEYHPDVNIATGKVDEGMDQPELVDVLPPEGGEKKSMVLVDGSRGFEEVKEVLVFDKLFVSPYTGPPVQPDFLKEPVKNHPYTDINEIKASKSSSELYEWEKARKYYFEMGGMESMLGPREDSEWYWRRAAKAGRDKVRSLEKQLESLKEEMKAQTKAYNRTKCCVASHHGEIDEEGNVWWQYQEEPFGR